HLERRTLPYGRFDPDATTMHLDDLLGDGEAQTGAALGLGKGAVDLMELFEDTRLLLGRDTRTRIGHSNIEVPIYGLGRDPHLSGIRELDRVADEVEEHLGEALLVAEANW